VLILAVGCPKSRQVQQSFESLQEAMQNRNLLGIRERDAVDELDEIDGSTKFEPRYNVLKDYLLSLMLQL
jgi:hypothetical protein